jgi:small subunit ribosomal protein S21
VETKDLSPISGAVPARGGGKAETLEDRMPKIQVRVGESLEKALRRFKRVCSTEGIFSDEKRNRFYEKPSDQRRRAASEKKRNIRKALAGKRKKNLSSHLR